MSEMGGPHCRQAGSLREGGVGRDRHEFAACSVTHVSDCGRGGGGGGKAGTSMAVAWALHNARECTNTCIFPCTEGCLALLCLCYLHPLPHTTSCLGEAGGMLTHPKLASGFTARARPGPRDS